MRASRLQFAPTALIDKDDLRIVGDKGAAAAVVLGNVSDAPPLFQIDRFQGRHRRTPERSSKSAIPQIGFRQIQFRQLIITTYQPFQRRILRHIQ